MYLGEIIKFAIALILIFALVDVIKIPRWGRFGGATSTGYWGLDRLLYILIAIILVVWALGVLDRLT